MKCEECQKEMVPLGYTKDGTKGYGCCNSKCSKRGDIIEGDK